MIAYNEEALLPDCLESIYQAVDEIIVVEGRMADFPGVDYRSDDDTVAIARGFGALVIGAPGRAWHTEHEMRSQYLRGVLGDCYFVIDADEVLITPLPHPDELAGNVYRVVVRMQEAPRDSDFHAIRIYRHTGVMQYLHAHDAMHCNGLMLDREPPILDTVQLYHQQPKRSKERRALKRIKRVNTVARELKFRRQLIEDKANANQ